MDDHTPTTNGKPRVLIIGPTLKQPGGIEMLNEIMLASDQLNARFELMHLDTTRGKAGKGQAGTLAPINFYYFFRQLVQLVLILVFRRPQIMHQPITDRISFWKEGVFMLMGRLFRVRVVGHLHGSMFKERCQTGSPAVRRAIITVLQLPHVIIALSNGWRDFLLNAVSHDLNVVVVPNTVDNDFAALARRPHQRLNHSESLHVLFVGSLITRKGLPDALQAVPGVRQHIPHAEFTFAGQEKIDSEQSLIAQARDAAIATGGVHFPGAVSGQTKLDLFKQADVFLLPSYNENLPIAVIEAMSAGLPLVVTPVGGLPEYLEEGKHCFFVEPGDVAAITDRLIRLGRDPECRRMMSMANLELYCEEFDQQVILGKFDALYESLIA